MIKESSLENNESFNLMIAINKENANINKKEALVEVCKNKRDKFSDIESDLLDKNISFKNLKKHLKEEEAEAFAYHVALNHIYLEGIKDMHFKDEVVLTDLDLRKIEKKENFISEFFDFYDKNKNDWVKKKRKGLFKK